MCGLYSNKLVLLLLVVTVESKLYSNFTGEDLEYRMVENRKNRQRLFGEETNAESSSLDKKYQEVSSFPTDFSSLSDQSEGAVKSRKKRAVFNWPTGSRFVADMYLQVPLRAPTGITLPFTVDFPYRILMPDVDFLTTTTAARGRSMDEDRTNLFGFIEDLFGRLGIDGRTCMLRAVCERAEAHVMTDSMVGEVISLLLQVSSGLGGEHLSEYKDAEYRGRNEGGCGKLYPGCPLSIFRWMEEL